MAAVCCYTRLSSSLRVSTEHCFQVRIDSIRYACHNDISDNLHYVVSVLEPFHVLGTKFHGNFPHNLNIMVGHPPNRLRT